MFVGHYGERAGTEVTAADTIITLFVGDTEEGRD